MYRNVIGNLCSAMETIGFVLIGFLPFIIGYIGLL